MLQSPPFWDEWYPHGDKLSQAGREINRNADLGKHGNSESEGVVARTVSSMCFDQGQAPDNGNGDNKHRPYRLA